MSLKAALSLAAVLVLFLVVTRASADWLGVGSGGHRRPRTPGRRRRRSDRSGFHRAAWLLPVVVVVGLGMAWQAGDEGPDRRGTAATHRWQRAPRG